MRMLAASVNIAHRAGKIIREIMQAGDLGTVTKGKNDFQTEADRSAQKCILASLYKQFPKAQLFGEEESRPEDCEGVNPDWVVMDQDAEVLSHAGELRDDLKGVKEEDVVVWIDPLDGTAEYTQGLLDHVTVLIGICVAERPVAGVMYQPYYNYQAGPDAELGRVCWGVPGIGVFGLTPKIAPEGQNIITTTRSHSNRTVVDSVEACEPTEILRAGGCGHKVMLILEGKAHAYVFGSPGCKKWDTAAPEAIVYAAGGKLTDIHGNQLPYGPNCTRLNGSGVLAVSEGSKHQWYLDHIPQHVKDALPFKA